MKADIDFDECQMRTTGNGSSFTRVEGRIKAQCVSLVSTSVHLGSAQFDSFVPACRFTDRAGYWCWWQRSSPPSRLTGVTVIQTVAANGTSGIFRCMWHQSESSALSLKWPSSLTQHIADVPLWSYSTHINDAKCMLMTLFYCFGKTNPHYGYKWLQGVGCVLASCSMLFKEKQHFLYNDLYLVQIKLSLSPHWSWHQFLILASHSGHVVGIYMLRWWPWTTMSVVCVLF